MTEFPDTRDSLLVQVADPGNAEAWEQFACIYRPIVYRLARRRGLQDADAQDLAQQVLIAVAAAIGRWRNGEQDGRFRHWLRRVAKNAILNALQRRPKDQALGGSAFIELLHEQPHQDDAAERELETEYRRELFLRAADVVRGEVKPSTWQAFELTVIEGLELEAAARELGKNIGAIYAARSRIMRRIRETIREIEDVD